MGIYLGKSLAGLILAGKKSFNLGGQDISLRLDKAEINPEK